MPPTLEERFWAKVDKSGECWTWTAATDIGGYGVFNVVGRMTKAHRYSWELHNTPIPDGLLVLHHCDNPVCVRPTHLFLGTQRDNVADMDSKDRRGRGYRVSRRGEAYQAARLSDARIEAIKAAVARGDRHRDVADWFGVSRTYVGSIVRGETRVD